MGGMVNIYSIMAKLTKEHQFLISCLGILKQMHTSMANPNMVLTLRGITRLYMQYGFAFIKMICVLKENGINSYIPLISQIYAIKCT